MILKDIRTLFFYLFLIMSMTYPLFGVPSPKDSQRIAFVNNALRYLGTPYRYAGHSSKGMDCSGFVYRNGSDILKLQMPRRSDAIAEYAKRITDEEIQPGDLLFFGKSRDRIRHVGIYLGNGEFIHEATQVKVGSLTPSSPNYDALNASEFVRACRIIGAREWPGISTIKNNPYYQNPWNKQ